MGKWLILLGLALLGGCGGATDLGAADTTGSTAGQLVKLERSSNGQVVSVTTHDRVDITLRMVGPGNYGEPSHSSDAVEFRGMEYPAAQNPGGPTQIYHFQAVRPGSSVIAISSSGSGDPFTVTLQVE
jgi:hypothetical protein